MHTIVAQTPPANLLHTSQNLPADADSILLWGSEMTCRVQDFVVFRDTDLKCVSAGGMRHGNEHNRVVDARISGDPTECV
jgi:hypothetical protein